MPYTPPTDESIKFLQTGAKDSFPTVFDAGSSANERYTRVWAEYHNKIRNFAGVVQPLCSTNTASGVGGISGLTHWTLNPAPRLADLLYGSAKTAYEGGFSPPSHILPFEIVITTSLDNYSNWPKLDSGLSTPPMLYQASASQMSKIVMGADIFSLKPMVQTTLRRGNILVLPGRPIKDASKWIVSSYCVPGTDTLLIRGAIIDTAGTATTTATLPSVNSHFPNELDTFLAVTIVGIR